MLYKLKYHETCKSKYQELFFQTTCSMTVQDSILSVQHSEKIPLRVNSWPLFGPTVLI